MVTQQLERLSIGVNQVSVVLGCLMEEELPVDGETTMGQQLMLKIVQEMLDALAKQLLKMTQ